MFSINEIQRPKVLLLKDSGLGIAETAARTCYNSFDKSNNKIIQDFNVDFNQSNLNDLNIINDSPLLERLTWATQHHSILEHITFSFYIEGISRGVLQEHARHRIQSISVKSTRYTMSNILYAFLSSMTILRSKNWFISKILEFDMFVINNKPFQMLLISQIWDKLYMYWKEDKNQFLEVTLSKDNLNGYLNNNLESENMYQFFIKNKSKRNVGDNFKTIVDDNWKTDMVCTFNLRSLKNYLSLRDSGAAYYQIKILAEEIKKVIPKKYFPLIIKNFKD